MRAAHSRRRIHFIYLHHVFEDEEDGFRRVLEELSRSHSFVSYSDAVARLRTGRIDAPYVSLSFDDGLKNCVRAAEIMGEFGALGCFFVCPPMAEATPDEVSAFCAAKLHMPPTAMMSWDDMERLRAQGHEIGSHTLNHANLAQTHGDALAEEVGRSRELIEGRLGEARHFAWPFGRFAEMSEEARRVVFGAGYESCASAQRGCHVAPAPDDPSALCLRRDHVVAAWPVSHVLYFMARSAERAGEADNAWPGSFDSCG